MAKLGPQKHRRVHCWYDTLLLGVGQDAEIYTYNEYDGPHAREVQSILPRYNYLFGQKHVGYTKYSNILAAGVFPGDATVHFTAIQTVLRFESEALLEDVKQALRWQLLVGEHEQNQGLCYNIIVPFAIPITVPPRQGYAVVMEWMDERVRHAVIDAPGRKVIRFELYGEECRDW